MSTTVEGSTCGYHSRLEGYGVSPGEACLCQLLTDKVGRGNSEQFSSGCCLP